MSGIFQKGFYVDENVVGVVPIADTTGPMLHVWPNSMAVVQPEESVQ